jgi:hypothetical protein
MRSSHSSSWYGEDADRADVAALKAIELGAEADRFNMTLANMLGAKTMPYAELTARE